MNIKAVIKLIRPLNAIIASIAVFTGAAASNYDFIISNVILASFSASFVLMSGNAINDVYDLEADRVNRSSRPLPKGEVTKTEAIWLSLILALLGVSIAFYVNLVCFLFASFFSSCWYFYARYLKPMGFLGNVLVSIGTAATFIFGAFSLNKYYFTGISLSLLFAFSAFLLNLGREIIKGIEDMPGDKIRKCRTLAILRGSKFCGKITIVIYFTLIIVSLLPFCLGLTTYIYLFLILIADILVFLNILQLANLSEKNAEKTSRYAKLSMILGMIAFLLGALF